MQVRRTFNPAVLLFLSFLFYSTTAVAEKRATLRTLEVEAGVSASVSAGYTIQVGAYSSRTNAHRVIERLQRLEIDAYCFSQENSLARVRIGKFSSRVAAVKSATHFLAQGIISEFLVVKTTFSERHGIIDFEPVLREELVKTTERFIGLPYRWGQASLKNGFDCSGLTMTVYRLNGLQLPRSSTEQWRTGIPVAQRHIKKGDLVFFIISGNNRISHVGIYVGGGCFIHAPGKGKRVRIDSLSNSYFRKRFAGARSFF